MTSAEFAIWIVRSLALALAAVLVQRAWPGTRGRRAALPNFAFAALLALTAQAWMHGPEIPLALPASLAAWPVDQVLTRLPSRWPLLAWVIGLAALLIREAVGAVRLRTFVRASRPLAHAAWSHALDECRAQLQLAAPVELRISEHLGPAATGLRRRLVLLPSDCAAWSTERRRFILLHELAHFRHGDLAARLFARLVCAVQWFNPFVWLLARRMDFDREAACDAAVAAATHAPAAYAETLLDFATAPSPLLASAFGASRRSTLEARILRLLAPVAAPPAWLRFGVGLFAAVAFTGALALGACTWPRPSANEVELRLTADPFPGER